MPKGKHLPHHKAGAPQRDGGLNFRPVRHSLGPDSRNRERLLCFYLSPVPNVLSKSAVAGHEQEKALPEAGAMTSIRNPCYLDRKGRGVHCILQPSDFPSLQAISVALRSSYYFSPSSQKPVAGQSLDPLWLLTQQGAPLGLGLILDKEKPEARLNLGAYPAAVTQRGCPTPEVGQPELGLSLLCQR